MEQHAGQRDCTVPARWIQPVFLQGSLRFPRPWTGARKPCPPAEYAGTPRPVPFATEPSGKKRKSFSTRFLLKNLVLP